MTVPEGLDTSFHGPLFTQCVQEGVIYVPGDHAFAPEPVPVPTNHIRLTFGVPGEPELIEGTRRWGRLSAPASTRLHEARDERAALMTIEAADLRQGSVYRRPSSWGFSSAM